MRLISSSVGLCFNPRTHVGCDLTDVSLPAQEFLFQSTHPRRVRPFSMLTPVTISLFQSTHPRRVRQNRRFLLIAKLSFNPRTHVGCDKSSRLWGSNTIRFQSTHPRRVRQLKPERRCDTWGFNPRTHVGCDTSRRRCRQLQDSFNPRTHVGCD